MNRPKSNEYNPYYQGYIALVADDIFQELANITEEVLDVISPLSDELLNHRYAEGKWSVKSVFQHMIDVERVMAYRALTFARGDKTSIPGFDHDRYADETNLDHLSKNDMIELYLTQRNSTISLLKSFTTEELCRVGSANGSNLSARAISFIICGHDKHHLAIIKERYLN